MSEPTLINDAQTDAKIADSYLRFDSLPDSSSQTTVTLALVAAMFPTAFRTAIIGMTGASVEMELDSFGNSYAEFYDGDLSFNLSLSVGEQVYIYANYYDSSDDSYFSGTWSADPTPDPLTAAPLVFETGSWDSTETIEALTDAEFTAVDTAANFPGLPGKFAVYENEGQTGIAYCSVGGLTPVWHAVDSAWIASRLAAGSLAIGQVAELQAALNEKQNLISEYDTKGGLLVRDDDNARWRINISTGGVLSTELSTDALVSAYFDATGIESAAAEELQEFVTALSDAGVLANMVDGSILKSRHARIQSGAIRTLRGLNLQVLTGNPTLGDCGIILNGSNQGVSYAVSGSPIGNRTFICLNALGQAFQSTPTVDAYAWHLVNGYPFNTLRGDVMRFDLNQSAATVRSMYSSGTTLRATSNADGVTRTSPPKSYLQAHTYDYGAANYAANAATFRTRGGTKRFGAATLQSDANGTHEIKGIVLGALAGYNNLNPSSNWCHEAVGGWLIFDRILSDTEIEDVFEAVSLIAPRWRYSTGGDSLMNFQNPYVLKLPELFGTNVSLAQHAVGGATVPAQVAALGTSIFTAAHLTFADGPVVADYLNIDTITGAYTKEQYHTDLRAIWTHIKTVNPAAKIIGQTITTSEGIETEGTVGEHHLLNDLIRADEGIYYDVLVDNWQIAEDLKRPDFTYQHNDTTVIADGVHPSGTLCNLVGAAKIAAIESLGIRIR
jgi:hypothetical protein